MDAKNRHVLMYEGKKMT